MADPTGDASDEMLMVKYQRGDTRAFCELVSRHNARVYNFILRFLRDPLSAEDLTQEVFYRVVKYAADFKHESRFPTWLYTIARNLCVDHIRKQKYRRHASLDEQPASSGDSPTKGLPQAREPDAERATGDREIGAVIVLALYDLPEEQREVFLLREFAGLPFKEIALATGVPENTVKSRMRYALERLQEALSSFEEYVRELR
jgi:RNA polymerase sigma-70 factor (ECF subfamily)